MSGTGEESRALSLRANQGTVLWGRMSTPGNQFKNWHTVTDDWCPSDILLSPHGRDAFPMQTTKFQVVCENHLQYYPIKGVMTPFYVEKSHVFALDSDITLYSMKRDNRNQTKTFDVMDCEEIKSIYNVKSEYNLEYIRCFLVGECKHQGAYFVRQKKMGRPKKTQ